MKVNKFDVRVQTVRLNGVSTISIELNDYDVASLHGPGWDARRVDKLACIWCVSTALGLNGELSSDLNK